MRSAWMLGLSCALALAAGCAPGGNGGMTPRLDAPAQAGPNIPAGSSAARHILGRVTQSTRSVKDYGGEEDDGGWSELDLPALVDCGNGSLATDCRAWALGGRGGGIRSVGRATESAGIGAAPVLNFCRDAARYPNADLGVSAQRFIAIGTQTFTLRYLGAKPTPIVSFATRWSDVTLTGTFAPNATLAPAIALTPAQPNRATRGWLLFFTWSWPADVLLIPFAVNEIQVSALSSPLAIAPNGTAPLLAFDCLGEPITARALGSGIGFSADLDTERTTSSGNVLKTTVYGGVAPSGTVVLRDDRGAQTIVPVAGGAAATPPAR